MNDPNEDTPLEETADPYEADAHARKKRKKRMIVAIIVLAVLGGVSWFLLEHADVLLPSRGTPKVTSMYSDRLLSYTFYPTDYDLDVTKNEYYMGLDRYIHVQKGSENFAITDGDYASWGEEIEMFAKYFDAAIHGDADMYNSFFTQDYYKNNEPYELFAPQMIYGITLEQKKKTDTSFIYDVTYAIYRNDGTFRNDIDSDAFKTLIFELVYEKGAVKINSIDYYRTAPAKKK